MSDIIGTLRPAYNLVVATIVNGANDSKTDILRNGDKYYYYIDGITVVVDDMGTGVQSGVLIDFSMLNDVREDLLVSYPYSLRGTRNNPNYIPLTKTSKTNEMPLLMKNKEFYVKVANASGDDISGVSWAIFAYPVITLE